MMKTFITDLLQSIMKHNLGTLASAISFFGFSAMLPVCLLLIFGATLLIPVTSVETFLETVLQSYVPKMPTDGAFAVTTINRLIAHRTAVGIIGLIGLLWTTIGGFVSFQQILDAILEVRKRRSFLVQYGVGFGMLGILLALTIVSASIGALSPALVSRLADRSAIGWIAVVHLIGRISFPLILFITCYFCYRVLPSHKLSNAALFAGSGFATVSIYVSRAVFVLYTHHLGNYQLIYGTLTFVMLLTFWIYIVSWIFLLGAEISASVDRLRTH